MIRTNSLAAYRQIQAKGMLSPKRWDIYKILFNHGPLTYNEVFRKMQDYTTIASANIGARLNEMREMGCADERGNKTCSITGATAAVWDVTGKVPRKLTKDLKPTRKELEHRIKRAEMFFTMVNDVFGEHPAWIKLLKGGGFNIQI